MKSIINVYILADTSFRMQRYSAKLQNILARYARILSFEQDKVKLHIIGYNDKARIISPYTQVKTGGNPNLGKGFEYLESIIRYQRKYEKNQVRSIFLLHSSDNVLQGWNNSLQRLFKLKEFAFGLRYVITYGKADKYAMQAFSNFTDSQDKILPYFSEKRLSSLTQNLRTSYEIGRNTVKIPSNY